MLQGYVDIVADVGMVGYGIDCIVGERGGIGVVQTYPWCSALVGQPVEQFAESTAMVEVKTVPGGVLTDNYQFLYTAGNKCLGLGNNVFYRAGMVCTTDERYGTVRTAAVAAFGNFEVGVMLGSAELSWC